MRSRMDTRTVASAISSPPTTSVTTCSPSDCSVIRSATGSPSATVVMAAAWAASSSTPVW